MVICILVFTCYVLLLFILCFLYCFFYICLFLFVMFVTCVRTIATEGNSIAVNNNNNNNNNNIMLVHTCQ